MLIRYGNNTRCQANKQERFGRKVAIILPGKSDAYLAVNDLVEGNKSLHAHLFMHSIISNYSRIF